MEIFEWPNFTLFILAYLLGSIPTAVWTGKLVHKVDIRKHGSFNAGATNMIRVLGAKTGIPVLIFDIIKGWFATYLVYFFTDIIGNEEQIIELKLFLGLLAVFGHLYPVFANFKGGKGIATIFGMFLGLHASSALITLGIFVLVFLLFKIVSLSSMVAVLAYPIISYFGFDMQNHYFIAATLFFAVLVIFTHRKNIDRLRKGQEKKLSFSKKGKGYD